MPASNHSNNEVEFQPLNRRQRRAGRKRANRRGRGPEGPRVADAPQPARSVREGGRTFSGSTRHRGNRR